MFSLFCVPQEGSGDGVLWSVNNRYRANRRCYELLAIGHSEDDHGSRVSLSVIDIMCSLSYPQGKVAHAEFSPNILVTSYHVLGCHRLGCISLDIYQRNHHDSLVVRSVKHLAPTCSKREECMKRIRPELLCICKEENKSREAEKWRKS